MQRAGWLVVATAVVLGALLAGCPTPQDTDQGPVTAAIGYSARTGAAPLEVIVTAVDSTSTNGGPLQYAWNFDDGDATSTEVQARHVYEEPGRYEVKLTVTDPTGATDTNKLIVQVQGGNIVAVIGANPTSGGAPLSVQFDGTQSVATDDTIRDYVWDFGDTTTSSKPQPRHTYTAEGTFRVTLRVVSAGGAEAETFTTITVGATANASLLFDGTSFATFPVNLSGTYRKTTAELWFNAQSEGGQLFALGGAVTLAVQPSLGQLVVGVRGSSYPLTAGALSGRWRHVALVYDADTTTGTDPNDTDPNSTDPNSTTDPNSPSTSTGVISVYLDGALLGTAPTSGALSLNSLIIGNGLRGKVGEVRLWRTARTAAQILSNYSRRLASGQTDAAGVWPLIEGSGQVLQNRDSAKVDGVLGSSVSVEGSDPAWSTDGPPIE